MARLFEMASSEAGRDKSTFHKCKWENCRHHKNAVIRYFGIFVMYALSIGLRIPIYVYPVSIYTVLTYDQKGTNRINMVAASVEEQYCRQNSQRKMAGWVGVMPRFELFLLKPLQHGSEYPPSLKFPPTYAKTLAVFQ